MSAEIVPFPFRGQRKFLAGIKTTFDIRRGDGQKRKYIDGVLVYHVERMKKFGVAPELIADEVAFIERLFFGTRVDSGKKATA